MATDATGTPTTPDSLPKYLTSADAPSGKGFNAAMDAVQTALSARASKPAGIASGEVPVWNGTTWVRSTTTNIGPTSLGSGTPDATKFLRGDGTWQVPATSASFAGSQGFNSAVLGVGNASNQLMPFDTFQRNITGYTFSGGKVVVPTSGTYRFTAQVVWPGSSTGDREILLHQYSSGGGDNGILAHDDRKAMSTAISEAQHATCTVNMTAGMMLGVVLWQNSGAALNVPGGAFSINGNQQFFIEYLGA